MIEVLKTRHNKLGFVGLKYDKRRNLYYELHSNNIQEKTEKANVVQDESLPEMSTVTDVEEQAKVDKVFDDGTLPY